MNRICIALAVAAVTCGVVTACGGAREGISGAGSIVPTATQQPSDSSSASTASGSSTRSRVELAPSAPVSVGKGCPHIRAEDLDVVVARALRGLENTTSKDGWSRACAWLTASRGEPSLFTIQIGWQGSLREYAAISGANPVAGLADEAYALDTGRRIALRSGELVALLSYHGAPGLTEALARTVAVQLLP